jgi:hypothetical protein
MSAGVQPEPTARFLDPYLVDCLLRPDPACQHHAAIKKVDHQKGTYEGSGAGYLWFHIPLQILFIGWVWYFSIQ